MGDLEPWFRGLTLGELFPEEVVGPGVLEGLGLDPNATAGEAVLGGRLWSEVEQASKTGAGAGCGG